MVQAVTLYGPLFKSHNSETLYQVKFYIAERGHFLLLYLVISNDISTLSLPADFR
jgi:hypothetical protein